MLDAQRHSAASSATHASAASGETTCAITNDDGVLDRDQRHRQRRHRQHAPSGPATTGSSSSSTAAAAIGASVTGSTFTDNKRRSLPGDLVDVRSTGSVDVTFDNNDADRRRPATPSGRRRRRRHASNSAAAADISTSRCDNNNIQQAFDDAIDLNLRPRVNDGGLARSGTVVSNMIGTARRTPNSGSESSNSGRPHVQPAPATAERRGAEQHDPQCDQPLRHRASARLPERHRRTSTPRSPATRIKQPGTILGIDGDPFDAGAHRLGTVWSDDGVLCAAVDRRTTATGLGASPSVPTPTSGCASASAHDDPASRATPARPTTTAAVESLRRGQQHRRADRRRPRTTRPAAGGGFAGSRPARCRRHDRCSRRRLGGGDAWPNRSCREIRVMSFDFPPKGWALCNGQLLPINQNQALFSLLGTTFGGDGQVNFALPDLRARTPIHVGQWPHARRAGRRAGAHALDRGAARRIHYVATASQRRRHAADARRQHVLARRATSSTLAARRQPHVAATPAPITNVGGSQAHLNMQPFLTL